MKNALRKPAFRLLACLLACLPVCLLSAFMPVGGPGAEAAFAGGGFTWYLPDGATDGGMETWVLVQNPEDAPVTVDLTLMTADGPLTPPGLTGVVVPANSRSSFYLGTMVTTYDVATMVTSHETDVICECAIYGEGRGWGTDSIGSRTPASTWYLAEGATGEGFETWVLVQNPGATEAVVDLTLMTGEGLQKPDSLQGVTVPAGSRRTFNLAEYVTTYDVSTLVTATAGNVVCERAMYGEGRGWGHDSVGVTTPASTWYLAEGATGEGFETWVLVQNPGATEAVVDLSFNTSAGLVEGPRDVVIQPYSRRSFNLAEYVTDWDVSTMVASAGGLVVAERAMYGIGRQWAHDSVGVTDVPAIPTASKSIPVGSQPNDAAVNSTTNRAYVTNTLGDSVSVIDGASNTVTATVPVGSQPWGIAVNPATNRVYAGNSQGDSVSVIDGATNKVVKTIPEVDYAWDVCVNSTTNRVYVVNAGSNTVTVINGATNTVTAVIPVGIHPWCVDVNPTTNRVYVSNSGDDTVSVINGATNTVTAVITVGDEPNGVRVNPATNRVYVTNFYGDSVSVINGATGTVTAVVPVGSGPAAVGVNPLTGMVYVANLLGSDLTLIDGATNTVAGTMTAGVGPVSVGVNPTTGKVYVVNGYGNDVTVL